MATHAEEATYFFLIVMAAVIVVFVTLCSFRAGIKTMLKRGALATLVLASLTVISSYYTSANTRSRITEKDCVSQTSPGNRYVARVCYMGRKDVLQLRSKDDSRLLVERTFDDYGDPVKVYWEGNELQYITADGEGGSVSLEKIRLPPTLYDRLLARLP